MSHAFKAGTMKNLNSGHLRASKNLSFIEGVRYWEKIICTYIMYFKWSLVRRQLIIRRLLSSRRCNTLTVRFLHTPIISLLNNAVYKKQGLKSLKHYATEGSVKLIANNLQSDVFQITYFKF